MIENYIVFNDGHPLISRAKIARLLAMGSMDPAVKPRDDPIE
jgi:hypothetical protein